MASQSRTSCKWSAVTELSELCLAIVDCEHKTAPKSDEGYPLIRTTDIGRGRLDLSDVNESMLRRTKSGRGALYPSRAT